MNADETTAATWRARFGALPQTTQEAVYDHARTACPDCGVAGVPASWAVVAVDATLVRVQEELLAAGMHFGQVAAILNKLGSE